MPTRFPPRMSVNIWSPIIAVVAGVVPIARMARWNPSGRGFCAFRMFGHSKTAATRSTRRLSTEFESKQNLMFDRRSAAIQPRISSVRSSRAHRTSVLSRSRITPSIPRAARSSGRISRTEWAYRCGQQTIKPRRGIRSCSPPSPSRGGIGFSEAPSARALSRRFMDFTSRRHDRSAGSGSLGARQLYRGFVLLARPGKVVRSIPPGDVVQIIVLLRFQRRPQRGVAGAGDRSRRKSGPAIGIVRRIDLKVLEIDPLLIAAERIKDRGVDLQLHSPLYSIFKDPGDARAILLRFCFALDH